ncbi:MAG: aminopeptidase P family protein [Bacteroidota bacterium]
MSFLVDATAGQACLVTFLPDVRWACGFSGSNGLLLATQAGTHFFTDGRYTEQAAQEVNGAEVHVVPGGLLGELGPWLADLAGETVIVQADHLSLAEANELHERYPAIQWEGRARVFDAHVARKTDVEIEAITRAQRVTEQVFEEILPLLKPGITEREIAAEIVYRHLKHGASAMSFDPIVAAGPNGALPHARPTDRAIQTGELVVIDMGGFVDGYASDMTRTVAVGEPAAEARQAYEVVRRAQLAALDAARAGLFTDELDAVARGVISEAGLGAHFSHSLGHGVGLQIHEWPSVSYRMHARLEPGMVVTIEPGVYIPGQFGIRIEDIIVVQDDGCEVITRTDKSFRVLG